MSAADQESPDDAAQGGGISAFEFENLTPAALTVIRLVLRNSEMPDAALRGAVAALPDDERVGDAELNAALRSLIDDGHLLQFDEPLRYKVNLRRKHTSTLRRAIWDALGEHDSGDERQRERARRRNRVQNVWEMLDDPAPRRTLPTFTDQTEENNDQ